MVTSWQAVKQAATRRPIIETKTSWLNLLNFMRVLHRGPSACSPRKTQLLVTRIHCKSRLRDVAIDPQMLTAARRLQCRCAELRPQPLADRCTQKESTASREAFKR